ncbi:MAG TPA: hypothetical protein VN039_03870 [Nitrospira sp.]|nr:hypothetical protein [Nitrospira sp.]
MKVFRLYFKPHNRSQQTGLEVFIRASNESAAVSRALTETRLTEFAAIMVDVIDNAIIIDEE